MNFKLKILSFIYFKIEIIKDMGQKYKYNLKKILFLFKIQNI